MSFHFAFNGNSREKLHELADRQRAYTHVPGAAIDFVKHAITSFPDGTMLMVEARGHKAHVNPPGSGHPSMIAAAMEITVTPVVPTD